MLPTMRLLSVLATNPHRSTCVVTTYLQITTLGNEAIVLIIFKHIPIVIRDRRERKQSVTMLSVC